MKEYYLGSILFNSNDVICHGRTKGSRNGISTTPGYKAIGKLAGKTSKEIVPLANMVRNHKLPDEYKHNKITYKVRNSNDLFDSTVYMTGFSSTFSSPISSGKDKRGGLSRNDAYQNSGHTTVMLERGKLHKAFDSGRISINKAAKDVSSFTSRSVKDIGDWGKGAIDNGKKIVSGLGIEKVGKKASKWVNQAGKDIGNTASKAYNSASKWVNQAGKDVSKTASKAYNDTSKWAANAAKDVGKAASKAGKAIESGANSAVSAGKKAAKDIGNWGGAQLKKGKKLFKSIFG